ncbi:MAG: transcriptional regulator [Chloroflexi bacterium]|nr:helix-turn-helix transcriptional regulator [Chloroflexota bacterium]MQC26188.1 transcriptional regulator [Chloroflexota bacterium]
MSQEQAIEIRGKILGVLLRDARVAMGKSMKELGDIIGASGGRISSIERGLRPPSLPELELLAYFLDTPIGHFWRTEIVSEQAHPSENLEADTLIEQRNRTIGATLRQARNEGSLSQKDLAKRTGISASRIRRYENGESPAPIPELELLAETLGYRVEQFGAKSGKLGDWLAQRDAVSGFLQLPKKLQDFASDPENEIYLEMAQKLSAMSPERLKALAEGLLEISNR